MLGIVRRFPTRTVIARKNSKGLKMSKILWDGSCYDINHTSDEFNFGNRRENIILCKLRNKTSNLNAHLLKDYLIDDPQCLQCGYEFEVNVHYFLECPKYTQQIYILSQQFWDIGVPFQINFILNGSSEYSHNLNCKIFSYVHNYIKSSRRFWYFCNYFLHFFSNGLDSLIYIKCMYVCVWM